MIASVLSLVNLFLGIIGGCARQRRDFHHRGRGAVEFDGPTPEATRRYYADAFDVVDGVSLSTCRKEGSGKARFTSIRVRPLDELGRPMEVAHPGCDLSIEVDLQCQSNFAHANLAIIFYDSNGYRLIDANTAQKGEFLELQAGQMARATFQLREVLLKPGRYLIGLWLGREDMEVIDHVEFATTMEFAEGGEGRNHTIVYPGAYVCRFEENVSILQPSLSGTPPW